MSAADYVIFEAQGVAYTLRFDINALCDLEDATGVSINQIGAALSQNPKIGFIRTCFWAGLRQSSPEMTLHEAGGIIGALGIEAAGDVLTRALTAAFPKADDKDGDKNPPKRRANGTGTNS